MHESRLSPRVGENDRVVSDYRLAPPLLARIVGGCLLLVAICVFAATVVTAVAGGGIGWVALVALAGLLLTLVVGWVMASKVAVLHLDPGGYRIRLVRGADVRAAAWTDVTEIVEQQTGLGPLLVLRLTGERSSTVPLDALRAEPAAVVAAVRAAVEAGHRTP